jgi:hypothetical protein
VSTNLAHNLLVLKKKRGKPYWLQRQLVILERSAAVFEVLVKPTSKTVEVTALLVRVRQHSL